MGSCFLDLALTAIAITSQSTPRAPKPGLRESRPTANERRARSMKTRPVSKNLLILPPPLILRDPWRPTSSFAAFGTALQRKPDRRTCGDNNAASCTGACQPDTRRAQTWRRRTGSCSGQRANCSRRSVCKRARHFPGLPRAARPSICAHPGSREPPGESSAFEALSVVRRRANRSGRERAGANASARAGGRGRTRNRERKVGASRPPAHERGVPRAGRGAWRGRGSDAAHEAGAGTMVT